MHSSGPRSCGSGSAQWNPLKRKNILWMLNIILWKLVSAKLNISPHRKSVKSKCAVQRNLTWWLWKSEQSPGAWNAAYGMAGYHKQCKIYKCRRHSGEIWRVGPTMQISVKWDHNLATDYSSTIPPPFLHRHLIDSNIKEVIWRSPRHPQPVISFATSTSVYNDQH